MMDPEIKQFGYRKKGIEYLPRPGAYAIISNSDGDLAVVEVGGRYYLIGGGLEPLESEQQGLRREAMEETGQKIESSVFLGRANQYADSIDGHFNKMESFYRVELAKGTPTNPNPTHVFRWVTREQFRLRSGHEAQAWAVENFLPFRNPKN